LTSKKGKVYDEIIGDPAYKFKKAVKERFLFDPYLCFLFNMVFVIVENQILDIVHNQKASLKGKKRRSPDAVAGKKRLNKKEKEGNIFNSEQALAQLRKDQEIFFAYHMQTGIFPDTVIA
jgi:hypothetical protein